MHRPWSRDRDRHLDVRHRHLDAGRSLHRHRERRLGDRHRHRRRPDDRRDDLHLRDERLEAHGADPDAELPGGGRLGSAGEDRLRHLGGGHHRLRHRGACPGSRRTGCYPGANGPCLGWMRTGCSPDGDRGEAHGDAGWRGLRHLQPARALRRRERRGAGRSAWLRRCPLRVQQVLKAQQALALRLELRVPQGRQAPACAWGQGWGQTSLQQRSWGPEPQEPQELRVPRARMGRASCRDGRWRASRRRDAGRPASTPRELQPEAARRRRRWTSALREGDGPRGARRSTMRS